MDEPGTDTHGGNDDVLQALLANIERVVLGKRDQIELVACALLCEGHVLLDDVPGTAKTVLARAIARSVEGATTARIQCTPDLQPSDVTGLSVYDQRERAFTFQQGPVFTNILLVDEINRAMPRTQSALLEAMAERQITVDGYSRSLPSPFLILATENPLDHEGVFPLPEAQLDRFFLKAALGYPRSDEELEIVQAQRHGHPLDRLEPVIGIDDLRALQRAVEDIYIDPLLQQWVIDIVRATRELPGIRTGLVGARLARPRARLPGDGPAPRPRLRRPDRRREPRRARARPPADLRPRLRSRRGGRARAGEPARALPRAGAAPGSCSGGASRRSMTASGDLVFPLIPSRRGGTLDVAGRSSRRRGSGDEVASSRPYRRGDPWRTIDWAASARLSTARDTDEFVVRDHFAEDAVRVVIVADRSRSMALFPAWLPWLDKPAAVRVAARMILASGVATNALIGCSAAGGPDPRVVPSRRGLDHARAIERHLESAGADGPPDSLDRALELLARSAATILPGTFVFVLSDFLPLPAASRLHDALAAGWDVVPVVVQDPVWERSFPDVGGVTLPLLDPDERRSAPVRLSRKEAAARRLLNEERAAQLQDVLVGLGLDQVTITSSDPGAVHAAFLAWADGRRARSRGAR